MLDGGAGQGAAKVAAAIKAHVPNFIKETFA